MTGVDDHTLWNMTFYDLLEKINVREEYRITAKEILHIKKTKICPLCFKNSSKPYCKKLWDLIPVTACYQHRCLLVDICGGCNRKITWYRNSVTHCKCGYDFTKSSVKLINLIETAHSNHIHNLLEGLIVNDPSLEQDPALQLEIHFFIPLLYFISGHNNNHSSSISISELHSRFTNGFEVLRNWPYNFYQFLNDYKSSRKSTKLYSGFSSEFRNFAEKLRFFVFWFLYVHLSEIAD